MMIGIDTGGTFTDAVLFHDQRGVLASSKALTTQHDLSLGIRTALETILKKPACQDVHSQISMVSLSTTLATNAVVENQGGRFCLMLIGYPDDALKRGRLGDGLRGAPVVFVRGGHTVDGDEKEPLDFKEIETAVETHAPLVDAFAVSGYFGVRNPKHEIRVRDFIRKKTGLPVSCGHTLTSNLHASRRALTTAFNARLIPLLKGLIEAVGDILGDLNIQAPLMVVKGDGSLVTADFALDFPVETILSGPAASLVGAVHLTGQKQGFVADMGGTTTDIAVIRDGVPCVSREGAEIGGWKTMVEAAQIYTTGLGGDSSVSIIRGDIKIGPKRHIPLSLLAHHHPDILPILQAQRHAARHTEQMGRFVVKRTNGAIPVGYLSPLQTDMLERLAEKPLPETEIFSMGESPVFVRHDLRGLIEKALVDISAFTPSDAAHVLGYYGAWSGDAAKIGADLFKRTASAFHDRTFADQEDLARSVIEKVRAGSGECLVLAALKAQEDFEPKKDGRARDIFIQNFFNKDPSRRPLLDISLTLKQPVIAIGAPVETYYPSVAQTLNTPLIVPPHAHVANAVGAVAGNVIQRARFKIVPRPAREAFRVHATESIRDFADLEAAIGYAESEAGKQALTRARKAGAHGSIGLHVRREEKEVQSLSGAVLIEINVIATATGRPRKVSEQA